MPALPARLSPWPWIVALGLTAPPVLAAPAPPSAPPTTEMVLRPQRLRHPTARQLCAARPRELVGLAASYRLLGGEVPLVAPPRTGRGKAPPPEAAGPTLGSDELRAIGELVVGEKWLEGNLRSPVRGCGERLRGADFGRLSADDQRCLRRLLESNLAALEQAVRRGLGELPSRLGRRSLEGVSQRLGVEEACPKDRAGVASADGAQLLACLRGLDQACADKRGGVERLFDGGRGGDGIGGVAGATVSWETAALTGLATFLVDRAAEELIGWLVENFASTLCRSDRPWFPATCALVAPGPSGVFPQAPLGAVFAAAVRRDLEAFPLALFKASHLDVLAIIDELSAGRPMEAKANLIAFLERLERRAPAACAEDTSGRPALRATCTIAACATVARQVLIVAPLSNQSESATCAALREVPAAIDAAARPLRQGAEAIFPAVKLRAIATADCSKPASWPAPLRDLIALERSLGLVLRQLEIGQLSDHGIGDVLAVLRAAAALAYGDQSGDHMAAMFSAIEASRGLLLAADALGQLFTKLREGGSPAELLAGLGTVATAAGRPLCSPRPQEPETPPVVPVACAIAGAGTAVRALGGIAAMAKEGEWNEARACLLARDLGEDHAFRELVERLFGPHPPPGLAALLDGSKGWRCEADGEKGAGYEAVAGLLRGLYDLELLARRSQHSGVTVDSVRRLAVALLGVIRSAGELFLADTALVRDLTAALEAVGALLRGDFGTGVRDGLALLGSIAASSSEVPPEVRRYGLLLADLAAARTAPEVSTILATAAAPVGSWKTKRSSRASLTITSVVGLQGGGELVPPWSRRGALDTRPGGAIGPTASLGLELAGPLGGSGWSLGAYVPLIDLGQLAWVRLGDGGNEADAKARPSEAVASTASEVSFLSVLSPGLYLKLGLGRSPFTFGIGASYAPGLRKYFYQQPQAMDPTKNEVTSEPFSVIRFGAFLGLDLTLLPVATTRARRD